MVSQDWLWNNDLQGLFLINVIIVFYVENQNKEVGEIKL